MLKEIKPRAVVTPQPVFVIGTYDAEGRPDAMTLAWGGQNWDNSVEINLSSNHKTTENIRLNKGFTLHIADAERVELADYFGLVSGHNDDKMNHVHATVVPAKKVNAPIIEEFVLAMECKVTSIADNGHGGVHVVGEIVRTVADDTLLTDDGHIDIRRLHPIVCDLESKGYYAIGEMVGVTFGSGKNLM